MNSLQTLRFPTVYAAIMLCVTAVVFSSTTNAASVALYDASADPAANPDGNGNTVDVWTVSGTDGGSFLTGSFDGNTNLWTVFDRTDLSVEPNFNNVGGKAATHTFVGGALTAGQTVSIDYAHNTTINSGTRVGVQLLDASDGVQADFAFPGGSGFFVIYDTGTNTVGNINSGKNYDPNDLFKVTFNIGASGSYSGIASAGDSGDNSVGAWSGSVLLPIAKIRVFTEGGDNSDQRFDNLNIVPEPTSFALLGFGAFLGWLRRKRLA